MKRKRYRNHHIYKSIFMALRTKMRFEIGEKLKDYKTTDNDWVFESLVAYGYIVKKKGVDR